MIQHPCVILCGGKSSRMGQDKALLPFGNFSTLAQYQHHRISKIFSDVYLSAKNRENFKFEFNFIKDDKDDIFSPSTALLNIASVLQKPFFVLSVDTPFIDESVFFGLLRDSNNASISVVSKTSDRLHPLCAIYTQDILEPLRLMLDKGEHKLQTMLKQISYKTTEFDNDDVFLNLNNKEEYQKAKNLLNSYM